MGLVVSLFVMFFAWSFVFDIGPAVLGPMFVAIEIPGTIDIAVAVAGIGYGH